jgi:hypothetical protein
MTVRIGTKREVDHGGATTRLRKSADEACSTGVPNSKFTNPDHEYLAV